MLIFSWPLFISRFLRGFLFQAIGVHGLEDKVTKERYLFEKKTLCSLSLPLGPLCKADRLAGCVWAVPLSSAVDWNNDKNLGKESAFVEVNTGEQLRGKLVDKIVS